MSERNTEQLTFFFILAIALAFSIGLCVGVQMERRNQANVRAFIECDTDEDCYKQNGCGGYADPCEAAR